MPDFTNIDYLRDGSPVQRECHRVLCSSGVMEILAPYGPVVAGTIPIGVDIPGSDIDILCRAKDVGELDRLLSDNFGTREGFICRTGIHGGMPVLVCSFMAEGMELEVFAQDIPATEQNGYRHMITEYELLRLHGDRLREKVLKLKLSGIKTEPAFAEILGLEGDPYVAVLEKGRELGLY